jgi:hypothetical protein
MTETFHPEKIYLFIRRKFFSFSKLVQKKNPEDFESETERYMSQKLDFLALFGIQSSNFNRKKPVQINVKGFQQEEKYTELTDDSNHYADSVVSTATRSLESIKIKRQLMCRIPFYILLGRNFSNYSNVNIKTTRYVSINYESYCNRKEIQLTRSFGRRKSSDATSKTLI